MTEIALRQDSSPALIPNAAAGLVEWAHAAQAAHTLAQSLVQTAFVPQTYRSKPAEATAAILAGAELGLNPLAALRAFDNIQGTAAPKAITLRAVAQSHGHKVEIVEESAAKVVARYRRVDESDWKFVEWTIEQARDLGLTSKDNWKKQPKAMLVARATSEAARRVASDALLGIPYSAEELQDATPEPTVPVARQRKTVQRAPAPQAPEPEFDEPQEPVAVAAERVEELRSEAQSKALHAGLTALKITDRDAALAYVSQIIGRDIESTRELTKAEASKAIDSIKAEQDATSDEPSEPTLDGLS
jgi:hypothetical protein